MRSVAIVLLLSGVALGQEQALRIGTVAPDGTGWARELRAMARDVAAATNDSLHLKLYMSGIAGDEMEMLDRIRRGQLDGMMSGGMACETLAPSLRVVRIPGLLQTWPETAYVVGQLRTLFNDEAQRSGFSYLGEAILGPSIVFSRAPVATVEELTRTRLWIWDIDRMLRVLLPAMGMTVQPLPLREALGAYERGTVDGMVTPAVVALAFQWSAAARYFTDLRMGFVVGCLVIANRALDALPLEAQQALRVSTAKAKARLEDVGRAQEEQLMQRLFQRQGLRPVQVDEAVRVAFFEAARAAREQSATRLVSAALVGRVLGLLADFRSVHR